MKKLFIFLAIAFNCAILSHAQSSDKFDAEFPLPVMPENISDAREGANFYVAHYWDRVNLNNAIKNRAGFQQAFTRFLMQIPMADFNVTQQSIDKLINSFSKNPQGLLTLAEIAESSLYSPDAVFTSDDFYLPFAEAVAANKKISKADKARFARQAAILSACKVGAEAPDFTFETAAGEKKKLSDVAGRHIILFVNDPSCDDCALARVRLSADPNINHFVDRGQLTVLSIYPDKADDDWRQSVAGYNPMWIVGASETIDDIYDTRSTPTIYYLNPQRVIMSKSMTVDQLLDAFSQIRR